ncbi:MAG: S8 family serine peptidase, partial [Actinomycetes bacterium]
MRLRSILASAISTSIVVAALAITPSTANQVDDLVSANYQDLQWGLQAVRAQDAWDNLETGEGVTVAVIDTGVDPTHPDLSGQIVAGATISYDPESLLPSGVTVTPTAADDFTDEYGHGTHVAGIIAAKHNGFGVTGLAYDAEIMPIKLANLDAMDLPAFSQSLVYALEYAADHGAKVANMSLGGPALEESDWVTLNEDDEAYKAYTTAICDAVTAATDAGVLVVVAAGNYYQEGNPALVPATCTDAVSVASQAPNSTSTSYF